MSFHVCRVCLQSEAAVILTPIFDGTGFKAEIFQLIGGIDISKDKYTFDTVICDKCMNAVEVAHELREQIRKVETDYFEVQRQESAFSSILMRPTLNNFSETIDPLKCSTCEKQFLTNLGLTRHFEANHKRTVACEHCVITVNDKSYLENHIFAAHQTVLNNKRGCDSEFQDTSSRKYFNESKEPPGNDLDRCTKDLKTTKGYTDRSRTSITENKCLECNKSYANKGNLNVHIKTIHKQQKRFQCDLCQHSFMSKYHMQRHLHVHIRNPNFSGRSHKGMMQNRTTTST